MAWWAWAVGCAVAASRTTNPLLLLLLIAVLGVVVAARRPDAPWARSFAVFLKLGLLVVAIRVGFQLVFGAPLGDTVVLSLPEVPLPSWLAGVRLGGDATLEGLLYALYDGLRLATLLACFGAANSLASPSRLLKSVPAALYEVGVAVVVALTFAPQLVADVGRVRRARRLRGRPDRGLRGVAGAVMPVFEGALDRSIALAAAMDSRGYGRTADVGVRARRVTAALLLGGLLGICIGAYGVLDGGAPTWAGLPLMAFGSAAAVVGLRLSGRRAVRTRYRPDPWAVPESLVAASGAVAGLGLVACAYAGVPGLVTAVVPPEWPALPLVPTLCILVALVPAWAAPPVPRPARRRLAERRRRAPASDVGRTGQGTPSAGARPDSTSPSVDARQPAGPRAPAEVR